MTWPVHPNQIDKHTLLTIRIRSRFEIIAVLTIFKYIGKLLLSIDWADCGKSKRVVFNFSKPPLGTFCDETGVENITVPTFKCSLTIGVSSSDVVVVFTFSTLFNGVRDFRFFGVLLPMSIMSISCVRPVLAVELSVPSSLGLVSVRLRFLSLKIRMPLNLCLFHK